MGALEVKPKSTDSFTLFYKLVRMVQQKQVDRSSAVSFSTPPPPRILPVSPVSRNRDTAPSARTLPILRFGDSLVICMPPFQLPSNGIG